MLPEVKRCLIYFAPGLLASATAPQCGLAIASIGGSLFLVQGAKQQRVRLFAAPDLEPTLKCSKQLSG